MCRPVFSQHEMKYKGSGYLVSVSSADIQEEKQRFCGDLGQYRNFFFKYGDWGGRHLITTAIICWVPAGSQLALCQAGQTGVPLCLN